MKPELKLIADNVIINEFLKTADLDISSVLSSIKDYVFGKFDKDNPIASLAALMAPGLLFSLGFPYMSILVSAASLFGFDWKSFWSKVGTELQSFAKSISDKPTKPTEAEIATPIQNIVLSAVQENFKGVDITKQQSIADDRLLVKSAQLKGFRKQADIKSKLAKFFIHKISWVIRAAFVALGFVAAEGAISTIINKDKAPAVPTKAKYQPSPSTPPDFFTTHRNDKTSFWIEKANIEDIENILISLVKSAYPDIPSDKITSFPGFGKVLSSFKERNKYAYGLDIISIPRPFERKIDIASTIVNS